jgi:hypothetical protein
MVMMNEGQLPMSLSDIGKDRFVGGFGRQRATYLSFEDRDRIPETDDQSAERAP